MEITSDPAVSLPTREKVLSVAFSPFEWSRSLLAVALPSSVVIYSIKFKEETEDESQDCQQVWECYVSSEPVTMAWSPEATLHSNPSCLQLLIGTVDHRVLQLTTDLADNDTVQKVSQHKNAVNSVAYSGDKGEFAASTGDDLRAQVWLTSSGDEAAKFLLMSPGVHVSFNPEDPSLMMVAEQSGIMRIYSVTNGCALFTLRCSPLILAADWSLADPAVIVAVGSVGLTVWNLSVQQPTKKQVKIGGKEIVVSVALSRSSKTMVATLSDPHTLRILHLHASRLPMVLNLQVFGGMSWHLQLPYLAVGSDRKVLIWRCDKL